MVVPLRQQYLKHDYHMLLCIFSFCTYTSCISYFRIAVSIRYSNIDCAFGININIALFTINSSNIASSIKNAIKRRIQRKIIRINIDNAAFFSINSIRKFISLVARNVDDRIISVILINDIFTTIGYINTINHIVFNRRFAISL